MRRLHLFEWEDQAWLPATLRDLVTDHLRDLFTRPMASNLRRTVADILLPPLARSGADRIVDVCSGGGGPLPALLPLLEAGIGRPIEATLTDRFPNRRAFEAVEVASGGRVRGERAPVSAFDVPLELGSFQTLFTAFHHFDPEGGRRILADAARKGRVLVVIEPFRRRDVVPVAIGGFVRGVVATPRVGPMTLGRFLWTYPIPISAFVLAWDGAVSCLRAHSADAMRRMGDEAAGDGYRWTAGVAPIPGSPVGLAITWLIGEPDRAPALAPEGPLAAC